MRLSQMMMLLGGKFSENDFTFTGTYEWTSEDENNWHIEFKTNGTLVLKKSIRVDLYLLGGGQSGKVGSKWGGGYHGDTFYAGGAGGQGGFIKTVFGAVMLAGSYEVVIGYGGTGNGGIGGTSSISGYEAPGGGSNSTGLAGGALGGSAGYSHSSWTPYGGGDGDDSQEYDFTGKNRGGGGGGGYSAKEPYSGSTGYNDGGYGGELGGAGHNHSTADPNYGGGGVGGGGAYYGSPGAGGTGSVQIRNAR